MKPINEVVELAKACEIDLSRCSTRSEMKRLVAAKYKDLEFIELRVARLLEALDLL